jgi:electron transport complex protein RnfD
VRSCLKFPPTCTCFTGKMMGSAGRYPHWHCCWGCYTCSTGKSSSWHIPVSILGTVFIFTGILWLANPDRFADPLFHLLTGGLMLGGIYMATDYVTSPMTAKGMIIYGIGIGVVTVLIRIFGAYPEGVQFAILIFNGFTPLINKFVKPSTFWKGGELVAKKESTFTSMLASRFLW